jgi:simple sugar transport system ATP-binding protein
MGDTFLSLSRVSKTFSGVRALSGVDFDVKRGEIHCLVGENGSGKSTLIKIIAGVVQPDPGCEVVIGGRQFRRLTTIDSMYEGIQVIYQDLSLFPNLTVAENISINQFLEEHRKLVRTREIHNIAADTVCLVGADLDLSMPVGELPIAKQQLVAICRALTRGEKLIVMDEPTSSLGRKDIDYLFSVIRNLKNRGISVLFVGHKLNEVFDIADRVTILRDGNKVGTYPVDELDGRRLIKLMTGRDITAARYEEPAGKGKALLRVEGLTKQGQFTDVNFELFAGEILGLIGLVGSGRTELALAIFGLNAPDHGELFVRGERCSIRSVQDAMRLGIGYVPEDRISQGLFMEHSVRKNMIVTLLDALVNNLLLLDRNRITEVSDTWIRELNIKTSSPELLVKQLSGGNQQRVVLSKWLERNPRILILDGPTIGIDVGAKDEIHGIMRTLADKGIGIVMISDEVSEVVHHSHRILLMKDGRIEAAFNSTDVTESDLLKKLGEK